MFTRPVMLRAGQELREFVVLKPERRDTESGRAGLTNQFVAIGKVRAILAQAKPDEIQRWRQLNHPITHKIIMQRLPDFPIMPGYIFEWNGRRFYHTEIPYNVGDIGHWSIFYCNERADAS